SVLSTQISGVNPATVCAVGAGGPLALPGQHTFRASAIVWDVLRRVEEAHHEIADHLLDLRDALGSSAVYRPGGGHVARRAECVSHGVVEITRKGVDDAGLGLRAGDAHVDR